MTYRTGYRSAQCEKDGCKTRASRRCRVCEVWVCRDHRFGAGHWFRCYDCPAEALRQARETWDEQVREERAAARAQEEAEAARLAELGPPHLSPPGTFRAGVWWGLGRMALLREVAEASFGDKASRNGAHQEPAEAHQATPTPGRGPRRGRAAPWRELRRWRRQITRRRGYGVPVPPRNRRVRRDARPRWARLARAAGALACALLLALVPLQLLPRALKGMSAEAELQAPGGSAEGVPELQAWTVDIEGDGEAGRPGLAPRPVKGQKRAPCDPRFELEVSGVCWLPVEAKPPRCPPQTVAHEGKCLLPLGRAQGPPVSVDAGQPG